MMEAVHIMATGNCMKTLGTLNKDFEKSGIQFFLENQYIIFREQNGMTTKIIMTVKK